MKRLVVLFLVFGVMLFGCVQEETVAEAPQEQTGPTVEAPEQIEDQDTEPIEIELDENCDAFPDNLDSCTRYKCEFLHIFTGEPMVKEIFGIVDGKCNYVEEMPNNGKMECNYSESMRKAVAQYYRDVAAAESVGTEIQVGEEETKTTYTIDGIEVENPLQEAIDNGQCVISGY